MAIGEQVPHYTRPNGYLALPLPPIEPIFAPSSPSASSSRSLVENGGTEEEESEEEVPLLFFRSRGRQKPGFRRIRQQVASVSPARRTPAKPQSWRRLRRKHNQLDLLAFPSVAAARHHMPAPSEDGDLLEFPKRRNLFARPEFLLFIQLPECVQWQRLNDRDRVGNKKTIGKKQD